MGMGKRVPAPGRSTPPNAQGCDRRQRSAEGSPDPLSPLRFTLSTGAGFGNIGTQSRGPYCGAAPEFEPSLAGRPHVRRRDTLQSPQVGQTLNYSSFMPGKR